MTSQVQIGLVSIAAVVVMSCGATKNSTGSNPLDGSSGGTTGGSSAAGGTAGVTSPSGGASPTGGSSATGGGSPARGAPSGGAAAAGATSVGGAGGSAGDAGGRATGGQGNLKNPNANVKLTEPAQVIDGFGFSTAWLSPPDASIKASVYDALFSLTKGAGLSLIRNRIPFRENPNNGLDDKFINKNADGSYQFTVNADGSKTFSLNWGNWDLGGTQSLISDIKAAGADYQVGLFMSTPWTPPNNGTAKWKLSDQNHTIDYANAPEVGGALDPSHYADYADVLADYALGYKAKMGVELNVLSLQNEPNFQGNYESADWSAAQFHSFFGVLNAEFTKKGVFTRLPSLQLIAPEFQNVADDLIQPTLVDATTKALIGVVGVHQYEFGTKSQNSYTPNILSASLDAGKRLWMTEWSSAAWATDPSITDGLILAKLLHQDLTGGSFSAFNYWWAWGTGNGVLVEINGTTVSVPKRLYVLGQFSRFIRPGWQRVNTVKSPASGVFLSAFTDAAGGQVAIVAINTGTASATLPVSVDAGSLGTITQYRTSASENIANVGTLGGGSSVNVTLVAASVTTFVAAIAK